MKSQLKILFKYPSRGRYERFIDGMDSIYNNIYDKDNFHVIVTADYGDIAMQSLLTDSKYLKYKNTTTCYGNSISKVHAINKNVECCPIEWDIIVNHADDMRWMLYGFDEIIRQQFADSDLDKLIHIPDQDAKSDLATMYIAGRRYYERTNYIYNPEYQSLFCDNEAQAVAKKLGKYQYVDCPAILVHLNSAYGHLPKDEMFLKQQEIGYTIDQQTFIRRQALNFDL